MMKLKIAAIALLGTLLLNACKEDDPTKPSPGIGGTMFATIDGTPWNANTTTINRNPANLLQFTGERNPTGALASGVGIELTTFSGVNVYSVNEVGNNAYLIWDNVLYTGTDGQIDVKKDNDTFLIVGFNFNAKDSSNNEKSVTGTYNYRKK